MMLQPRPQSLVATIVGLVTVAIILTSIFWLASPGLVTYIRDGSVSLAFGSQTVCRGYSQNGEMVVVTALTTGTNSVSLYMIIDTGATISFAPKSLSDQLGLTLTSGTPITARDVSGTEIQAYVHNLNVTIENLNSVIMPVAIAENEQVPNLIGTTGFLDQFALTTHRSGFCVSEL